MGWTVQAQQGGLEMKAAGQSWVLRGWGDAAKDHAASPGCSPGLSAMSLGEAGPKHLGKRSLP